MSEISAQEVARIAIEIFPVMGRVMEAYMRVGEHVIAMVHFDVLIMLTIRPHTVSELAEKLSVSAASVSKTVTVMEERNWVERTRSVDDRRVVYLSMTDQGRHVLREMRAHMIEFLAGVFEPLSQAERRKIVEGMEVLIQTFGRLGIPTSKVLDVNKQQPP
jgi:DNA-binding MarR family transcriptional regulator